MQSPKLQIPGGKSTKTLDPPDDFTITPEQIETLKRDGVVHIPAALSAEWLAYLRAATEWQINNPHIWASPGVASGIYDYIQRCDQSTTATPPAYLPVVCSQTCCFSDHSCQRPALTATLPP